MVVVSIWSVGELKYFISRLYFSSDLSSIKSELIVDSLAQIMKHSTTKDLVVVVGVSLAWQ